MLAFGVVGVTSSIVVTTTAGVSTAVLVVSASECHVDAGRFGAWRVDGRSEVDIMRPMRVGGSAAIFRKIRESGAVSGDETGAWRCFSDENFWECDGRWV